MNKIYYLLILSILGFEILVGQIPIEKLTNGGLLIRLQTNQNLINYHIDNLEFEKAAKLTETQNKKNQEIVDNFHTTWSFCPVYFFYSNNYFEIKDNNFNNVFKDNKKTELNNVEKEKIKDNFLIGYFGKYPGNLKFNALVLIQNHLQPLPKRMPRYVRTYKGLCFFEREMKKTIKKLEKKLEFHQLRIK